jgi:glycine/D-amino acid oxidase-like deaminating enzyme
MKIQSYWLDSAPAFAGSDRDSLPSSSDVVIVGAGYTGLSAALALARRGASVTVLEADRVIGQASGRNGGHCSNGLANEYLAVVAQQGREAAAAYYRAYTAAVDTVERVVREEQIDCGFERVGKLKLAAKPGHYEKLTRLHDELRKGVDPDVRLVPRDQLGDEIGSDRFYGGLLQTRSAGLHVGRFGVGLAEAAARRGARIHEHAPVTDVKPRGQGSFRVTSPLGTIEARQLLVATGCSSDHPFGWFRRRLAPVGSFIIATEPLDRGLLDRLFPTRRLYVTSRVIGNYFRTGDDDRLVFGGRARFAMSTPTSDVRSGAILRARMAEYFPELKDVRIDYCWGGLVDVTRDRLPRAGQHDGMYYSMGYSGHGVQMAVHMGQVMAEVMDGRPEANPWRDLAWPAIPGHLGTPWFLPMIGAWFRLQDLLH